MPSVRTQHTTCRVELTKAEAVPAKALRSTAAADARVASFMVDVMVWASIKSFALVEHMNSAVDTSELFIVRYVAPVGSIDS
jgi:hypothetical protein